MLDPFQPEKPEDVAHLKAIQQDIHEGFIGLVKGRRGAALAGSESTLFSGEYWTGRKAQEFGLVDRIGDLRGTLRERYGEDVTTPLISAERGWFGRRAQGIEAGALLPFGGVGFAEEIVSALEARALWARYGL
jgi:ClpP class serine protease